MDRSVLAVSAAYQNNLVSSENDDIISGSMSPDSNVGKNTTFAAKEVFDRSRNTRSGHNSPII